MDCFFLNRGFIDGDLSKDWREAELGFFWMFQCIIKRYEGYVHIIPYLYIGTIFLGKL